MSRATRSLDGAGETFRVRAATLTVESGPDLCRSAKMEQPTFMVGAGPQADLRLRDPKVSHRHLELFLEPNGVRVRDARSKNGTFLGGARVYDILLTSDATLALGGTTLSVRLATESMDLPLSPSDRFGEAIGTSPVMRHTFARLELAASSNLTVLLEGESGVGKDLLARAIHDKSSRKGRPFVVVDCSAIAPHLVESELFGHERGAFTGADRVRRGVIEEADGGTLFLDEIGELPLEMQPKLLRVMEQQEVRPVGASVSRRVDVRFLAATNRRLAEAARVGEFRSDLFYRLAVVRVSIPPLRERPEDVLPIARAMLRRVKGNQDVDLPADFASMLTAYSWPGNVRELRNVIERHAVFGLEGNALLADAGGPFPREDELVTMTYHDARARVLERFDETYLLGVLKRADGGMARAAEMAGVARTAFYRMVSRVRGRGESRRPR